MSRIGKKPIPLPAGVKYKVEGNTVLVEGPKGKVSALIAEGISLEDQWTGSCMSNATRTSTPRCMG